MLRRWVVATVSVAVLAGGCSSPHHPRPVRHPAPAPATAGAQYLVIADQANARIDAAKAKLRLDGSDLASTEDDLRAIASAKRTFDQDLGELSVPEVAKDPVARLLGADAVLENRLDDGAASPSVARLDQASVGIIGAGADAVAAADAVRRSLGLAPLN